MVTSLSRLRHAVKVGAYSAIGASLFPLHAARVLRSQRRRSSMPPPPLEPFRDGDPYGTGTVATLRAFMPDLAVYFGELDPKRAAFAYDYPRPFRRQHVAVGRGVTLGCRLATHRNAAAHPTLLMVPGMFATASQNVTVQLCARAYQKWGFNVVVADMRAFGETARLSEHPCGMGGHEAEDVVSLARWAKREIGSPSVSVLGFSFGGAVTLSAALQGEGVLSRCVAFCPPLRPQALISQFSQPVRGLSAFSLFQLFYQSLLLDSARRRGLGVEHFHDYVEKVVADYYGMDLAAVYEQADVRARIHTLTVPTLVIHADDDPVVPYEHSLELARAAREAENRQLEVEISRGGGHYGHWAVMPDWTERTVRGFLSRVDTET
jgi:predicted alpha/beta-fold hydrolase